MDDWFYKDKKNLGLEFPNIPYLIHGENKLTETIAIHHYIAEVWDQSLLGKTVQDKAKVAMLASIHHEFRWKVVRLCYSKDADREKTIEEYKKKLPEIVAYIGKNDFLIGDYPTYIDFYFFETIQLLAMISNGAVLEEHKALVTYCNNFKQLKGVKDYLEDPFCREVPLWLNSYVFPKIINGKRDFK